MKTKKKTKVKSKVKPAELAFIRETAQDLVNYYFNEAELDGGIEWESLDILANRLQLALKGKL